jgi:myo-inositol-1(or 4)-monophosphatase
MSVSEDELLTVAHEAAGAAARELMSRFGGHVRGVRTKSTATDPVSEADLAAEAEIRRVLGERRPADAILGEEGGATGDGELRWIVDPLDGTVNYAAGLPWFSVTLAYQEDGVTRVGVTHAPAVNILACYAEGSVATVNGRTAHVSRRDTLADAVVSLVLTSHFTDAEVARTADAVRRLGGKVRGVRIIVSGGLEMTLVADGQLDAFVSLKADAVSHAAAMPLVRAAGGRVTRLDGRDASDDDVERVASNGLIHDALLDCLRSA